MKRDDLKKIEGITDEQVDEIMKLHQADVEGWNTKIDEQKSVVKERDNTIKNLTEKVKKYDGVDVAKLQEDLSNWETKYNEGLAAKDKEFATELLFNNYEFSSKYARKAVMEEFKEKNLEFKDGKFMGADDFFKELKESEPDTFKGVAKKTGIEQGGSAGEQLTDVEKHFFELNPDLKK